MHKITIWFRENSRLIVIVELVVLWLLFCGFIYFFLSHEFVKAFAPLIIGLLGALIAFSQFKLSKDQKKIAKERSDFDLRDKKYDVLKRWNKHYFKIISITENTEYCQLLMYSEKFLILSDELRFVFDQNKEIIECCNRIAEALKKIAHKRYIYEDDVNYGYYDKLYRQGEIKIEIQTSRREILKDRKSLLVASYKLLGFN